MTRPRPFPKDHPGCEFPGWVSSTYRRPLQVMPANCGKPDCRACNGEEES